MQPAPIVKFSMSDRLGGLSQLYEKLFEADIAQAFYRTWGILHNKNTLLFCRAVFSK